MGPKKQTRSVCIFGAPCGLTDNGQLYTNKDILAAMQMEINKSPAISSRYAAKVLEPLISKKWKEVNPLLPLISTDSIVLKIDCLYKTCKTIEDKHCSVYKKKIFLSKMDKLFDILICKCKFIECSGCPKDCTSAHIDCFCARKFKIPKQDLSFIKDQREKVGHNSGKMIIYGSKKVVAQEL